jgi:hypothetical protein
MRASFSFGDAKSTKLKMSFTDSRMSPGSSVHVGPQAGPLPTTVGAGTIPSFSFALISFFSDPSAEPVVDDDAALRAGCKTEALPDGRYRAGAARVRCLATGRRPNGARPNAPRVHEPLTVVEYHQGKATRRIGRRRSREHFESVILSAGPKLV